MSHGGVASESWLWKNTFDTFDNHESSYDNMKKTLIQLNQMYDSKAIIYNAFNGMELYILKWILNKIFKVKNFLMYHFVSIVLRWYFVILNVFSSIQSEYLVYPL